MGLKTQVMLYAVGTDAFYTEDEKRVHQRMLRLYKSRQNFKKREGNSWRVKAINRLIKRHKEQLSGMLDEDVAAGVCRELDQGALLDKNIIQLFESDLTRSLGLKPFELTMDLVIVNVFFFQVFNGIVHHGFMLNGERYIFLTASAGQIRTKKAVFIRESAFKRIEKKIMCGLTVDDINAKGGMNSNKFCAYLALANSATDEWSDFDIDKSIVVDDWETAVPGMVDHIDGVTYEIKREITETVIPHMDGCGIQKTGVTKMCRLPWVKGLMVTFPFDKFIKEKCGGNGIVTDIYGEEHDVIAEDIRYIFTKSQFKLWKFYDSWQAYKDNFKRYGCHACYCNMEERFISKSRINYQMLQTLSDLTDDEIKRITAKTIAEVSNVGYDYQTTMRLLGATPHNQNRSAMQEALIIYPELFKDVYNREILKQTKNSLVKQARGGRLRVNGKYLFISPDLYAFCEWLFLGEQNPRGLLQDGDVYTTQYRDGDELACLRSPHLYREWAIRQNRRCLELDYWFGMTKCLYTSCHDLISRYLMFD